MADRNVKTASVLAFERKLDPSDALFRAGRWDDRNNASSWGALGLREKAVRGTISNRLKTKEQDPAKLDASIQAPNLQRVDVCTLPSDADTLSVRFTLRVLGGAGEPSACNSAEYLSRLRETVKTYASEHGFTELARRYACNLANGRFLWRNRVGAERVCVRVKHLQNGETAQEWEFDSFRFSLRNFDVPKDYEPQITSLSSVIEDGLGGDGYVLLDVTAFARIGDGQEVFPSQELILDKGDKHGQKSKTLFNVNDVAAIHSQKIGNALRTIDNWYADDGGLSPIAVEPYGSVTSMGKAYRQPKQQSDFYSLLDAWVLKGEKPAVGNQHFLMATLIRGGVFGEKD